MPKPIFTGIPKGAEHNGGRIAFAADRTLFVGTGDTGSAPATPDPASLAGTVLRLDEFGKPAEDNPIPGSPVYARGFTEVVGMCPMDDGRVAALDHRAAQDLLIPLTPNGDYTKPQPGDALWTWQAAEGGAADCAVDSGILASTSLDEQQLTGIEIGPDGTFSGTSTADARRSLRAAAHGGAERPGAAVGDHVQQGRPRHTGAQRRPGRRRAVQRRRRRGRPGLTRQWSGRATRRSTRSRYSSRSSGLSSVRRRVGTWPRTAR